jgi:hypothetical protein
VLFTGDGRRLVRGVAVTVSVVTLVSLVLRILALGPSVAKALASGRPAAFPGFPLLLPLFDVDGEGNLPSWLSSALLLVAALLLWGIAVQARAAGDPWHRHWALLALAVAYLSLDEAAQVHERLLIPVGALLVDAQGVFTFGWVVVAGPVLVVFALTYLRFLAALPAAVRRGLVIAAVVYVLGALGLELVGGLILDRGYAEASVPYILETSAEEFLEMAGLTLLLRVLIRTQAGVRAPAADAVQAG